MEGEIRNTIRLSAAVTSMAIVQKRITVMKAVLKSAVLRYGNGTVHQCGWLSWGLAGSVKPEPVQLWPKQSEQVL